MDLGATGSISTASLYLATAQLANSTAGLGELVLGAMSVHAGHGNCRLCKGYSYKFLCVSNYRNRDHIQLTCVSLQK